MKPFPIFLKKYFWDVEFGKIDKEKYPEFIIGRILEFGDEKSIKWMLENFKKLEIKDALKKRRGISPRSANYWSLIFDIPKNKILCLRKQSQGKLQKTWPY